MPILTRIQEYKFARRANIYIDGMFAFAIPLKTVTKHQLTINKEISKDLIKMLKGEDVEEKIFTKAVAFCTIRPRSVMEVRDWFKRKKVTEEVVGLVNERLKNLQLIDDLVFAKWWIEQRQAFRPKSKRFIEFELRKKGIKSEIISKLLVNWSSEIEENMALSIAVKYVRRISYMSVAEQRKRLTAYLISRGFYITKIRSVVDQLI